MKKFTANLGRGIRAVYKNKPRARPAKLRQLREEIDKAQQTPVVSPLSQTTDWSQQTEDSEEFGGQGGVALGVLASPPESPRDEEVTTDSEKSESHVTDGQTEAPVTLDGYEGPEATEEANPRDPIDTADQLTGAGVEAEQALRNEKYLRFEGEDETDYTEGPVRLVDAFDGVKECGALLLNLDLSVRIQRALRAQRDFAKAQRIAVRELEVNLAFERKLKREISNHNSRLAHLEGDKEGDEHRALADGLSTLEMMLDNAKLERQGAKAGLESKGTMLREIQAMVNAYLEDAFVFAQLLEPEDETPDTPIEDRDLQQEYQAFRADMVQSNLGEEVDVAPLDTSRKHLEAPPLSPEDQAREDVKEAFWRVQEHLQRAQLAFARRDETRAFEYQANHDAAARGEEPIDASPEDFDARWVTRIQKLTHELIEAEAAFAEAKEAVLAAGVDTSGDDAASGFVDDVADGYRISFEQEQIASVPEPKVSSWLNNIPEQASPTSNDEVEMDDWETQTVGLSDSVSLVAEGTERRRIDKWRRVCGL